ncbi:hypothetical protein GJAV_G00238550 [Gymnothorax javanicus]|nr:hypothetical protein GJAV_G00238550 [Gymnothorax javanicus]
MKFMPFRFEHDKLQICVCAYAVVCSRVTAPPYDSVNTEETRFRFIRKRNRTLNIKFAVTITCSLKAIDKKSKLGSRYTPNRTRTVINFKSNTLVSYDAEKD